MVLIMVNKYKIWCCQREQYFSEESEFESLEDIKEQLISYHEGDVEEEFINKASLSDILEAFCWDVHDLEGNTIIIKGDGF